MMSTGGTYRIDDYEFPAPITNWEPQVIGGKLNGLPLLNSYYIHTWSWPAGGLETCDMKRLLELFANQNATGQLTTLETDPFDANEADDRYGTVTYSDFIIKDITPRTRELPHYASPTVTFEIYIS